MPDFWNLAIKMPIWQHWLYPQVITVSSSTCIGLLSLSKATNSACMGLMHFSSLLKQLKGEVHTHMFGQFQTLVNIFLANLLILHFAMRLLCACFIKLSCLAGNFCPICSTNLVHTSLEAPLNT